MLASIMTDGTIRIIPEDSNEEYALDCWNEKHAEGTWTLEIPQSQPYKNTCFYKVEKD